MTEGQEIEVLPGIVAVRRRFETYLGVSEHAEIPRALLAHVVRDVIREVPVKDTLTVRLELHDDHRLTCSDNGPGLPVNRRGTKTRPTATDMLSVLAAGANPPRGWDLAVVGAFCSRVDLTVYRDGRKYVQQFEAADESSALDPVTELLDVGRTGLHGTRIEWCLNPSWISSASWPMDSAEHVGRLICETHPTHARVLVSDLRS